MFVCICLCLSVCMPLCLCLCLCICALLCVTVYVHVCVCVCVCARADHPRLVEESGVGLCFSLSLLAFLSHRPLLAKDAHSLFFLF